VGKIGKALNRDGRFLGSEGYCIGGKKKRRVVDTFSRKIGKVSLDNEILSILGIVWLYLNKGMSYFSS